jgi:hypothetical protein
MLLCMETIAVTKGQAARLHAAASARAKRQKKKTSTLFKRLKSIVPNVAVGGKACKNHQLVRVVADLRKTVISHASTRKVKVRGKLIPCYAPPSIAPGKALDMGRHAHVNVTLDVQKPRAVQETLARHTAATAAYRRSLQEVQRKQLLGLQVSQDELDALQDLDLDRAVQMQTARWSDAAWHQRKDDASRRV